MEHTETETSHSEEEEEDDDDDGDVMVMVMMWCEHSFEAVSPSSLVEKLHGWLIRNTMVSPCPQFCHLDTDSV